MLKSHERFHSANGKRLVLIAEDELINREILRTIVQDDYELIFAEDGQQTLDQMRAHKDTLTLVLLDMMMPIMSGMEVLKNAKSDPSISHIPIIVITSDRDSEVESLSIGASDFIPKPYPSAGVILTRMQRTIELSEDRQIISATERDPLTGLFNREYFYRYAEQYDQHHKDIPTDAIVLDVDHFHMINERFGTAFGDSVLRRIGEAVRAMVLDTGGIVCRREADTFMVYCPHGKDYNAILENASIGLTRGDEEEGRIRLRMGVYANVDKSLGIERRFDRAKMAADSVQGSFMKRIGIYDSALHEQELYAEQLVDGFATAIRERQFQVYFQPKFDVQPEIPVLASAEALVRWQHPEFGMISPGVFIPLFEKNGLIQPLDNFVWREAAARIREWKERFGIVVPVSVNVSRVDMYDPHLIETLHRIVEDNGLSPHELLLEITESAYTQDSDQIIATVNELRSLGFRIEMDDFGTGYSSLNMISTLPIDALKLDMQFTRNAFGQGGNTRMIEVIMDIAGYLGVPVIAEGVETEEQMRALRTLGCDFVQGYYFSRPVPAEEYEKFVIERTQSMGGADDDLAARRQASERKEASIGKITHALSSGFDAVYYIDTETDYYVAFSPQGRSDDLQMQGSGSNFFEDMLRRIPEDVHPEDQDRVALSLKKGTLLEQLAGGLPFTMTYRNIVDGRATYFTLKAVRAYTHDDHHIVIGVSNVDTQIRQLDHDRVPNALNFSSLAQALSHDVESIYYVDLGTDTYMEFKTEGLYRKLRLELSGRDFFGECERNIQDVVFPDDRARVTAAMRKDELLAVLRERYVLTMTYRLVIEGTPMYYTLKAVWADGADRNHVIIGVSNVDAQITDEEKAKAARQSSVTYASIVQALAADYFSIYYVDTESDRFIEYSSDPEYRELDIEQSGDDFFNLSRHNIQRVAHPDDVPMFLEAFTKENVLAQLERNRTFTLTYRLMFADTPTYVHMKATRMEDAADKHIVIGVSNVDDQIRREHEHDAALRMANRDALTGVKSKHAYVEEERINQEIAAGAAGPFGVVVCDVNNLKEVNDTLGHAAGDEFIKKACRTVCNVFKHSPVFRVGGDEFVAILRGGDFDDRAALMARMAASNAFSRENGGILVANGLAEFAPGQDAALADVFGRADAAMYADKKELKSA